MVDLQPIYQRFGIIFDALNPLSSKALLLRALLERESRNNHGITESIGKVILHQLAAKQLSESQIDELLEQFAYKLSPKLFDPPRKERCPEDALILRSQIALQLRHEGRGISKAAKALWPEYEHRYPSRENGYKQIASRYHQIGASLNGLDEARHNSRLGRLIQVVAQFAHDPTAMRLWASFLEELWRYRQAYLRRDFGVARYSLEQIDRLYDSDHPFVAHLILCMADTSTVNLVEMYLGPLLESCKRGELPTTENAGGSSAQDERKLIASILEVFKMHGYLPSNPKNKNG